MYQQTDKKSAVKEIQKYLYVISDKKYNEIPRIPIDGIFDDETKDAVIKFQEITLLAPTGTVDYVTFISLFEVYTSIMDDFYTTDYIFGDSIFPLEENDQNEDVRALHIMIGELRKTYPQITDAGSGTYFSKKTGDAIEELRELFSLTKSRKLDKTLYRRMNAEIRARQMFKEKFD